MVKKIKIVWFIIVCQQKKIGRKIGRLTNVTLTHKKESEKIQNYGMGERKKIGGGSSVLVMFAN